MSLDGFYKVDFRAAITGVGGNHYGRRRDGAWR